MTPAADPMPDPDRRGLRALRITIDTDELLAGTKATRCPHCTSGLVVDLPDRETVLAALAVAGGSVAEGLTWLSPRERYLFDVLYAVRPSWVRPITLMRAAFGDPDNYRSRQCPDGLHVMRVPLTRLRKKLEPTSWRVVNALDLGYRLERLEPAA